MQRTPWACVWFLAGALALASYAAGADTIEGLSKADQAGAFTVETVDATWLDQSREREVPVRILRPSLVAKSAERPLILFSHGLGGSRAGGKTWGEHWASHGYIVVHMQHAGSDISVLRREGGGLRNAMSEKNLLDRTLDVRFVIDEVSRNASKPLFADVDLSRIGMSGHSFGAHTTLMTAGQKGAVLVGAVGLDRRITSAIAFSPNARRKENLARQFGDIRIPFFSITGTKDADVLGDNTSWEDRTLPFQHMPPAGKFLAVFAEGDHMVFGGHQLRRAETARDREIMRSVKALTLYFWDAYLRDDAAAKRRLTSGEPKPWIGDGDKFEQR